MARVGRKPGTPKTGGRQKGTPNKQTAEIKALAEPYGPEAILVLAAIMRDSAHPGRIAATKEMLDRAYGKPPQGVTLGSDPNKPLPIGGPLYILEGAPEGTVPPETVDSISNTHQGSVRRRNRIQ